MFTRARPEAGVLREDRSNWVDSKLEQHTHTNTYTDLQIKLIEEDRGHAKSGRQHNMMNKIVVIQLTFTQHRNL